MVKKIPLVTSLLGVTAEQIAEVCRRALLKKSEGAEPDMGTHMVANFFDSGAFSLHLRVKEYLKEHGGSVADYYKSSEFMAYAEAYVSLVKTHPEVSQFYANIDVIGDPELTWQNQQLLEALGAKPIPVVHFGTDMKWLHHYIKRGYDYIGLGGLVGGRVGGSATPDKAGWIRKAFEIACPGPTYRPQIKFHGFGVSTWKVIRKYPWFSVDSAAWTKLGAYGNIMIPARSGNGWDFSRDEQIVTVSKESPSALKSDAHYFTMSPTEKKIVQDSLSEICVPLGELRSDGSVKTEGCITNGYIRRIAVLYTSEVFRLHLPPWDRPYLPKAKPTGLGLF